jgi:hypothetical protein
MAEKDTIFSSTIKYDGIFSFKDFYLFCHEWLTEETELDIVEKIYEEKIKGDSKDIIVKWDGEKKLTDYFRFDMKVEFTIRNMKDVEVSQDGINIKTNNGSAKVAVKGILTRDYDGKFEATAYRKFIRSIYEKWVITSRIEEMEGKIVSGSDNFLNQAKAYLDLEGKK